MSEPTFPSTFLSPHLVCDGAADAIEFYKNAFGAEEMMRMPTPDGKIMHAAVMICGTMVMLTDENKEFNNLGPKSLGGTPITLHLQVPNVDEFTATAVAAGAKVVMPIADMFWGDRYGIVEDPCGHRWSIATNVKKLTPEEMQAAAKDAMCGPPVEADK